MSQHARPDYPIHDLIAHRWSPYAYAKRPVGPDDLLSLLEAARWAASSYNEQPWSFLVATQDEPEEFSRLLSCLVPANQEWASRAPVLILTVIAKQFQRNGKPNRVAEHDLGLAIASLTVEATARGLSVHQMAGIDQAKARQEYTIPEGFEPCTAVAVGYAAKEGEAPEELRAKDGHPRARKPLPEIVFGGNFGKAHRLTQ
jgi:nitroreductase